MQRNGADQAINDTSQEGSALHSLQHAKRLAEAIEQQMVAAREARQWQEVVNKTDDRNSRRYFEGLVKLYTLKASHHNLTAQHCQLGSQSAGAPVTHEQAGHSRTLVRNPATRQKTLPETALIEKGRNKALTEYNDHHVKAEAFLMLADRYRALGLSVQAGTYEERARLESATTRGFQAVVEAYDKKLEGLGFRKVTREESTSLETSYRNLPRAERYLEDYNRAIATSWEHGLQVLECEGTLQRLQIELTNRPLAAAQRRQLAEMEDQRDSLMRLAEKEAINAAASYKNFQSEVQSAEKAHDALSRTLTGSPLELTEASSGKSTIEESRHSRISQDALSHPGDSGQSVHETKVCDSSEEPHPERPGPHVAASDSNSPTDSGRRMNRLAVGVVVCQALKVMDREL